MRSTKTQKLVAIFSIRDQTLLHKASTEQIRHDLEAQKVLQVYEDSNAHAARRFFKLFCETLYPTFYSNSTVMQSVLTKKKTAARSRLSQFAPVATERLLLFYGTSDVSSSTEECLLHASLHRNTGGRTKAAAQPVKRA